MKNIHVGQKFGNLKVIELNANNAVRIWKRYHRRCAQYECETNAKKKEGLGRWLDKEYDKISHSQYMMGVGLYAYQQSLRESAR